MSKKIVAMLMAVAMAFSLLPVTAFATDGPSATTTEDVVGGYYNNDNQWVKGEQARSDKLQDTVTTVDKTATKVDDQDNQYNVTLTVQMKHKETAVPPSAAATVLVIDKSGSMNDNNRLPAAKKAAINFLKSYSGFSDLDFNRNGSLKNNVRNKNLKRYVSLVTFNDSASVKEWKIDKKKESWIDVSTKAGYDKLFKAINEIKAKEGTNLDAALRLADTQMQSGSITQIDQSKRNVIALTDGVPTFYGNNVEKHGGYGCPDTNDVTTASATALKAKVNAVYTVCFGAANDRCWTKGSAHAWAGPLHLIETEWHKTDGPKVGDFLKDSIATPSTNEKQYAYNADNADKLYEVFAAITQTITDGLNEGVVTDGLPNGVSCTDGTFGKDRTLTWNLKSNEATVTQDGEYNVYTYTKTYTVNVDPATVNTVEVGGANYAPLNTPTTLTVQNGSEKVKIPFPIPAGKVTYSLTGFNKELVTQDNKPTFNTDDFTIPANTTDPVVVSDEGVTLLYKITVEGNAGAKFTVRDDGATLVSPDTIADGEDSTFSGTVGTTGETVFYVSKQFTKRDISSDTHTVSNTATIDPGDNTNGLQDNETAVTTPAKEPDPQTYTVTYQWADENRPSDATLPTGNPFILKVGQKHTVKPVPKSTVTENAGKTGIWTCQWDATDNEIQGNANDNIIIKGTWTFTETVAPKGTLTVTKKVDGRTLDQLPQNFTITVKNENGTTTETLTKKAGTATGNDTLTWTILDLPIDTYTVSEENAGVDGYDCTETYSSSVATDTEKSVTVTENGSSMTVTNTYTKKQEVVPTPDTSKPDVNKTATALANDKTDVTLSVGGKSAKENVAVMFLLDKSTSVGNSRTEAARMLHYLKSLTNTNIIYDVVIFSDTASSTGWNNILDDKNFEDTLKNFANQKTSSGTNMPAGIDQATQDMETLKSRYSSYAENAYLITISDGITYLWNEDGKTYTVPLLQKEGNNIYTNIHPNVDTWDMMYGKGTSIASVYGSFENFLKTIPEKIKKTQDGGYVQDYLTSVGDATDVTKYIQISTTDPEKSQVSGTYACAPEFSVYYSTTKYENLVKPFTKSFALPMPEIEENGNEKTKNWENYPWGEELMIYLQSMSSNVNQGVVHDADAKTIFAGIQNKILYQIQSGSITDVIGADFSLTDQTLTQNTFTLTANGNPVAANAPNGNVITFGEKNESTKKYPYVLTYYKGTATKNADNTYTITSSDGNTTYTYTPCDKTGEVNGSVSDEFFVLEMNVPVVSLDLKYNLSLTSKRTAAGTYEVPTNESATLEYTSANQSDGTVDFVDFNEPTVSYTVKGSSGSHSGGSRPSLNTKDHYGYIIGYPVDYYTGQPTTDQTKKPVRPEGKITRAEVATIYFRMLTDESRTKFWSQSSGYSDVKTGDWFNNAVSTLSNAGIIAGYEDGSFRPNGYITRAEFATIAARFFDVTYNGKDLFPDISGHWAKDYINQAANKGFVNGYEDGTFKPDRNITRAEAVTLVNRTLDRHPDKNHFTKDMLVWPDNMDQTKWYYADMQEATNSHTYQMKENSDKTKYENWTKTLPIRNWEALEKAWSNANSSQGNGNVV